jgi:hypothetical protein
VEHSVYERRFLMGNVVDFRKCESLDRSSQQLTDDEREQLEDIVRVTE